MAYISKAQVPHCLPYKLFKCLYTNQHIVMCKVTQEWRWPSRTWDWAPLAQFSENPPISPLRARLKGIPELLPNLFFGPYQKPIQKTHENTYLKCAPSNLIFNMCCRPELIPCRPTFNSAALDLTTLEFPDSGLYIPHLVKQNHIISPFSSAKIPEHSFIVSASSDIPVLIGRSCLILGECSVNPE